MNKSEFVKKVSQKLEMTQQDTRIILDEILNTVVEEVSNGSKVKFLDFGVFESRNRNARLGTNPRNVSEKIDIPPRTVPIFRAGNAFRQTTNAANAID